MSGFWYSFTMAALTSVNVWCGSNMNLAAAAFVFTLTMCMFLNQITIELRRK